MAPPGRFISPNMKSLMSTMDGTQSFGLPKNSRHTVRTWSGMRCTNQRPLVIKPRDELRLTATGADRPVSATFDGQGGQALQEGDELRIRRASVGTRLLSVPWRDYFEMLRVKLRWGGDR